MSTLMHFSLYQNSMVISSVLDCESVWTLTVDILNTICNRDCCADCSLDLTLIVTFWKTPFSVCRWKKIIISWTWNWTHLQFTTKRSNGCQCVLCNFRWFLLSIMNVTVLYLGGPLFSGHSVCSFKVGSCFIFSAQCYACTAYVVMRCLSICPSVCLSCSYILSKQINIFKNFSPPGSYTIPVSPHQMA